LLGFEYYKDIGYWFLTLIEKFLSEIYNTRMEYYNHLVVDVVE
jgi:hypothetical protein